jgi:hypothetical protein
MTYKDNLKVQPPCGKSNEASSSPSTTRTDVFVERIKHYVSQSAKSREDMVILSFESGLDFGQDSRSVSTLGLIDALSDQ